MPANSRTRALIDYLKCTLLHWPWWRRHGDVVNDFYFVYTRDMECCRCGARWESRRPVGTP
ncbi:hypothetical protein GobsT_69930 [Gemmata obscuriglobus]|nr:hypothetical protein GobsT_69930 [Gemmata obscuriglobus]VTS11494.1 unnamed protein product [Gemmata obscuriglobus UQM 2246]